MLKTFRIITFVLLLSIIVGCGAKNESELIQIPGYDAYQFFEDKADMMLVLIDEKDEQYDDYLKNLKEVVKKSKSNIYYVNLAQIDTMQYQLLYSIFQTDGTTSQFLCIQNGTVVVNSSGYLEYEQLKSIVNGKKYEPLDLASLATEKEDYYNYAMELLDKGLLGDAYYFLSIAIPNDKAIEKLASNEFSLLDSWIYEELDENNNYIYLSLYFSKENSMFYRQYYKGKYEDFNVNNLEYLDYEYYIKNNVIYVATEDDKDKKMYTIDSVGETLQIHTTKKTYKMMKG